jgi:hypothetical protein
MGTHALEIHIKRPPQRTAKNTRKIEIHHKNNKNILKKNNTRNIKMHYKKNKNTLKKKTIQDMLKKQSTYL